MVNIHKKWLQTYAMNSKQEYALSPIEKAITLHRRVFYDEQRENLIIITAEVVIQD